MITGFHRPLLRAALGVLPVLVITTIACDSALLAPIGSTITLSTLATTLPLSGTTSLIAQVIEPSGTPPQSGTVVTFTTSLGTIEPFEAETDSGGRVTVTFKAGTQSGTATITAVSGGVNTGATGAIKIAVGAAAVASIAVIASPGSVPASGGTSTISGTVGDAAGNVVVGVPVAFSTDNGSLSASVAMTDQAGIARVTLTTSKTAKVTATAGIAAVTVTLDDACAVVKRDGHGQSVAHGHDFFGDDQSLNKRSRHVHDRSNPGSRERDYLRDRELGRWPVDAALRERCQRAAHVWGFWNVRGDRNRDGHQRHIWIRLDNSHGFVAAWSLD